MIHVAYTFADGDDAAAEFLIDTFDVGEEFFHRDRTFGDVNQMRAIVFAGLGQGRGAGQEAGMASHDDVDLDARQSPVVEVVAHDGTGHELGGGAVAGAVVGDAEVVVDGLGDVEGPEVIAGLFGHVVDDVAGVGAVVAADVEEIADVAFLEDFQDLGTVGLIRLVAAGTQRRGRRAGHTFEGVDRQLFEVDEMFFFDTGNRMNRTVEVGDILAFAGFFDDADQRGVDNPGRAARLTDYRICHN